MTFHLSEATTHTFQCGLRDRCILLYPDFVLPLISFNTFPVVLTKLSVVPEQATLPLVCALPHPSPCLDCPSPLYSRSLFWGQVSFPLGHLLWISAPFYVRCPPFTRTPITRIYQDILDYYHCLFLSISSPLNRKPLWDANSFFILRAHHCIYYIIALVSLSLDPKRYVYLKYGNV